ncbi:Isonitrile hydratase [Streptomyces sp. enrichment culture]
MRTREPGAPRPISVCTGTSPLAEAGLPTGRRAASRRPVPDRLKRHGADPRGGKAGIEGQYVPAGIGMGLTPLGRITGDDHARMVRFAAEHAPQPPCEAGRRSRRPSASPPGSGRSRFIPARAHSR